MADVEMRYVGPIAHLVGKKALIRRATHDHVVAQFHECNLTREKVHPAPARFEGPWPEDSLAFGWHAFPESHFAPIGEGS